MPERTSIDVTKEMVRQLALLKYEKRLYSYSATIFYLLEHYNKTKAK